MRPFARSSLILTLLATGLALAQESGTQMRIRGTVQSFDGNTLSVATESDGTVAFALPETIGINGVARRSAEDVAKGGFIGTTATRDADGNWRASEVHIFPESMRGAGEGHYPWDFPGSTMTNATVSGTAAAGDGRKLVLSYEGGETEVLIEPQTDIVALVDGDRSLLVPGAAVFVLGQLGADGSFTPFAIIAEKDGVEPPM